MDGIFITGTDTGVGKTTISAGLLKLLFGSRAVSYWKPVQTGTIIGDDTMDVKALTELDASAYLESVYRYVDPIAPYMAAKKWNQEIDLDKLMDYYQSNRGDKFVIVEGAGGLLVPVTSTYLQDELVKRLGLSVIIVAENKLGTINQTLLTINQCRGAGIDIKGVILSRSRQAPGLGNAECISRYGNVDVLAEFEEASDRRAVVAGVSCDTRLRRLFGVAELPV